MYMQSRAIRLVVRGVIWTFLEWLFVGSYHFGSPGSNTRLLTSLDFLVRLLSILRLLVYVFNVRGPLSYMWLPDLCV